jgi:DNA primase
MIVSHLYKQSVYRLFEDLGFPLFSESLRCQCPIHGGDNASAFSFNFENGWRCWTHNCHEDYPKGLIGLIMAVDKCELDEAKQKLAKYLENQSVEDIGKIEFKRTVKTNKIFDSSVLPKDNYSKYFEKRGFSKNTMEKFQCFECLNKNKTLYNRAVVPIFDDENNLVAFTGRSIETSFIKWLHQPKSFYKSNILYNLNNSKRYLLRLKTVIIVEGPMDVWRLHEAGIYNVVALLGTSISYEQIKLIKKYNVKKVVILFDPDHAGLKSMLKENGIVDQLSKDFEIFSLRHLLEKDIGETDIDYINYIIKPELRKIIYGK